MHTRRSPWMLVQITVRFIHITGRFSAIFCFRCNKGMFTNGSIMAKMRFHAWRYHMSRRLILAVFAAASFITAGATVAHKAHTTTTTTAGGGIPVPLCPPEAPDCNAGGN
jgi:hypothetical protein